jgi:GNAT superfamily N-acetyltransferase
VVGSGTSAAVIRALGQPGDLGWVVLAHGEVYAAEFGWDLSFEGLVARIVADFAQASPSLGGRAGDGAGGWPGAAWIAELDGRRVGCVFCVPKDEVTAQLRILLVDPAARGRGLGRALVARCVDFARDQGFRRLVLWTVDPLVSAQRIYLAAGFELVSQERTHSFGVDLVGQIYALDLSSRAAPVDAAAPRPS